MFTRLWLWCFNSVSTLYSVCTFVIDYTKLNSIYPFFVQPLESLRNSEQSSNILFWPTSRPKPKYTWVKKKNSTNCHSVDIFIIFAQINE